MKSLKMSIAAIGVLSIGAAFFWGSASQGTTEPNVAAPTITIPGCAPSEELSALQGKSFSGDLVALEALKTRAADNDPCAQYILGSFYQDRKFYNEVESTRWTEKAISAYRTAAEKGNAEAQYQLGSYYWYVKRNLDESSKWWEAAANNGHAVAQFKLGEKFAFSGEINAEKREANEKLGLDWLRKAAEQGNTQAMFSLGNFYDDALQRKPTYEEAAKWYRRAAGKKHILAQRYLSNMYAKGDGVSQSWKNAYFWGCVAERCFESSKKSTYNLIMSYPSREQTDPLEGEPHLSEAEVKEVKEKASKWISGEEPPL